MKVVGLEPMTYGFKARDRDSVIVESAGDSGEHSCSIAPKMYLTQAAVLADGTTLGRGDLASAVGQLPAIVGPHDSIATVSLGDGFVLDDHLNRPIVAENKCKSIMTLLDRMGC